MNSKLISEYLKMTKIQKLVDKLRAGYHTKSIISDLGRQENPPGSAKN